MNDLPKAPHPETLRIIVADYRQGHALRARHAAWWQAAGLSPEEAVKRAGLGLIDGRLHPHQRRPGAAVMRRVAEQLARNVDGLARARTFEELHDGVADVLRTVDGAGDLVVYDTTDRLAHWLGLEPAAVHLHSGTRIGARRLGLGKAHWLNVPRLPGALATLSAREAEDVLCIYKDDFFKEPEELRTELAARSRECGCGRGVPIKSC